ncbi:hypothetical protein [Viridibacillus arvi]|uniref:hypothetical protein n=1 Tax=Viridibacillus arvi TaxID=263475 RepID=UPI00187BAF45|nr:hypothetical protein JNUCC6_16280 [Viridibacillus sp. JNUCC-6]
MKVSITGRLPPLDSTGPVSIINSSSYCSAINDETVALFKPEEWAISAREIDVE